MLPAAARRATLSGLHARGFASKHGASHVKFGDKETRLPVVLLQVRALFGPAGCGAVTACFRNGSHLDAMLVVAEMRARPQGGSGATNVRSLCIATFVPCPFGCIPPPPLVASPPHPRV